MTKSVEPLFEVKITVCNARGGRQGGRVSPRTATRTLTMIPGYRRVPDLRGVGRTPQRLWRRPYQTIWPHLFQFGAVTRIEQLITRHVWPCRHRPVSDAESLAYAC